MTAATVEYCQQGPYLSELIDCANVQLGADILDRVFYELAELGRSSLVFGYYQEALQSWAALLLCVCQVGLTTQHCLQSVSRLSELA